MVEKDRIASEQTEQNTITCLQNALNETQETIRAYDVKAEILGVLLALTIGIINYNFISDSNAFSVRIFAMVASLTGLIAVGLAGFVLYPMRNPYEVEPLVCPRCKHTMRILAFVVDDTAIQTILKHLGLWETRSHSPPPSSIYEEIVYVDESSPPVPA